MWVQRSMVIETDGGFWIVLGLMVLLFPLPVLLGVVLAAPVHELGHILLGHLGEYDLVNREPQPGDNPIEQAANVFASRLLAPACVLWALNVRTPEEIADICQISHQSASFRAERMAELYKRGKFLTSPLERKVYEQFLGYIQRQRINRS